MLPNKNFSICLSVLIGLLGLLTACSGNKKFEGLVAPDPNLASNPVTPTPTPSNDTQATPTNSFPQEIPRYPGAKLVATEAGTTSTQSKTRWSSTDPVNLIENYYQQEFQANKWEIMQSFSSEANNPDNTLVARLNDLEVKLSIASSSPTTEFIIEYQTDASPSPSETPQPTQTPITTGSTTNFADLEQVSEQFRRYIQDLANLAVLTSTTGNKFNPNGIITRRDYARWLVAANNKLYANVPSKQIRLAATTSSPAFKDIPSTDPDFPAIQGLAEAGWIASGLTGDNSALLFRPEAPLTRENLILWKVPLDVGKGILPSSSIEGIKETWGFQDAAKIDPKALRSLYSDFQNGEQANVRRVFGYTTLFQPKKPVSRAEAATSLWYFGFQGDGISAEEAWQIQQQPSPSPSPTATL